MSSQFIPQLPGLPDLPVIMDAQAKGLRLQGTLAKALPPMSNVGSMTNVRQMEAEQYARDISAAFEISRAYSKQSQARARARERQTERYAKNFGVR